MKSWLWQLLREMDEEEKRKFLLFVTGCSNIPLDGFDPPFNITLSIHENEEEEKKSKPLPYAHTCFNQLVLPVLYASYDEMKEKLLFAIQNTEGFGMT